MKDTQIKGNGKSRVLKAPADIPATFEEWRAQLIEGTAKMDIALNTETGDDAGCEVVGTPLSKGNLLSDAVATLLGLTGDPSVNAALNALASRHAPEIVTYTGDGTYGVDHPVSLTFSAPPKMLVLFNSDGTSHEAYGEENAKIPMYGCPAVLTTEYTNGLFAVYAGYPLSNNIYAKKSADGRTVSWYAEFNTGNALNTVGVTYHCLAIF